MSVQFQVDDCAALRYMVDNGLQMNGKKWKMKRKCNGGKWMGENEKMVRK